MEILSRIEEHILTLQFNRPEKKNAITSGMYQDLADALRDADKDSAIRAVIITGTPDIFTAGNDVEDFLRSRIDLADIQIGKNIPPVFQFMYALHELSKPIIAAVCGSAIGIGTTLLLHCDMVYCADNTQFALPFTPLGLCPEFASSLTLLQSAGYQKAAEKLLLGEAFSAQEAYDMGLINAILPSAEVFNHARQQAQKIAAMPTPSIRITKQLLNQERRQAIKQRIDEEIQHFIYLLSQPHAREAFHAFLEKRKPDFESCAT